MKYLALSLCGLLGCSPNTFADAFSDYWFSGKAEVSTYSLKQARYGEVYEGEATMIFVTEPFSKSKQVKLNDHRKAGSDKIDVLKMNQTRYFFTGVYPYSIMLSTFTPIEYEKFPRLIKATHSVQEWCGQTYMQVNARGMARSARLDSYFEGESDANIQLGKYLLEDDLWSALKIDPKLLPTGKMKLVPAFTQLRFRHIDGKAQDATASLKMDGDVSMYRVEYPALQRSLEIRFRSAFPYEIESWEEIDGQLKTSATLKARKHFPYWNHNRGADAELRKQLKME